MEKIYVEGLSKLDDSYYTYSYYGVDSDGDRQLEAVAIRRLGDALVAGEGALTPDGYLTAANWNAYVSDPAVGQSGRTGDEFTDGNVRSLIEAAFDQTRRTDVKQPVRDGLLLEHASVSSPTV